MADPHDVPAINEGYKAANDRMLTKNEGNASSPPRKQNEYDMRKVRFGNAPENAITNVPVGNTDPALLFDNKPAGSIPVVELLTTSEAAKLLAVSVPTIRRLQQRRAIPFIKIGGSVRFDKRDLVSYVERNRVGSLG
jgi:excisionase family DNA binding protein